MNKKCTFKLDTAGFRKEVLQSSGMLEASRSFASQKAGSGTHLKSFIGFDRAKTIVYPNTKEHPS